MSAAESIFYKILNKVTEKNNLVRLTGILAVIGMFLLCVVDLKLLYMPLGSRKYSLFQAALAHDRATIMAYSKLALFAIPLILIGIYHIYLTLAIANKLLARVVLAVFAFSYLNAAFYYAYLAYMMTSAQLVEPLKISLPHIVKHLYTLFQMLYFFGIIAGSIFFFVALSFFKGKNYPRWYIFFNPLYMILLFRMILPMATPPAISGFLITGSFNLIMLATFALSTIFMWNRPIEKMWPEAPAQG